jgi:nitrogen fixation/metabolism regulation signal transduction histidine kinase
LRQELLDGDAEVVADGAQLQQALLALLVNAVEAITGGSRTSGCSPGSRRRRRAVMFHVGDTGVGIHPDVLPHVFEPFFSTKDQESGVGLEPGRRVRDRAAPRQRHHRGLRAAAAPFHVRIPRRPAPDAAGPADA